jgi:hypothetical protein
MSIARRKCRRGGMGRQGGRLRAGGEAAGTCVGFAKGSNSAATREENKMKK